MIILRWFGYYNNNDDEEIFMNAIWRLIEAYKLLKDEKLAVEAELESVKFDLAKAEREIDALLDAGASTGGITV